MFSAKIIFISTFLVLLAEIAAGRHKGIYTRADWLVNTLCAALNFPTRIIFGWVTGAALALLLPAYAGSLAAWESWWTFVPLLFLADLTFYWGHRLAHEGKDGRLDWYWKLHRTHHSGKWINVITTLRVHPLWAFVNLYSLVLVPSIYFGLGKSATAASTTVYFWNLFTHSHFRWDDRVRQHPLFGKAFRALEHIIVSPGMHHSHHGYGKDGGNFRNYAVMFSFWDWVFGTLHIPEGRPWKYGLPGNNADWTEEVFWPAVRGTEPAQTPG